MSKDGATGRNRRAGVDEPSSTDEAALFGAALAAVVAIALVDGAWTVFDTIIGVCLASVLVAYFNLAALRDSPHVPYWRRFAFATVLGLTASLILIWPGQWALMQLTDIPETCTAFIEDVTGETATIQPFSLWDVVGRGYTPASLIPDSAYSTIDQYRAFDDCVGGESFQLFFAIWLLITISILGVIWVLRRKHTIQSLV